MYDQSFRQYQAETAYQYYLRDSEQRSLLNHMIKFKNFTIESFVLDSVLAPIQDIFMMTSRQFLNKYIMSPTKQFCQL